MPIVLEHARQALADAGFEELTTDLRAEGIGAIFRHSELPPPWSIIAALTAGDAPLRVDVALQFRGLQVGTIHRVTSHAALVANLPSIVASLTALVGSEALSCPRCHEGWLAVGQPKAPDPQGHFFFCTDCYQKAPCGAANTVPPIVSYGA